MRTWFTKSGRLRLNVMRRAAKPETKAFAKHARKHMTASEEAVWFKLHALSMRFRRQAVILGWIADFYHPRSKLVIEIDGGYHNSPEQQEKDSYRDRVMQSRGLRVTRIPAAQVFSDLDSVITKIVGETRRTIPDRQKTAEPGARGRRAVTLAGNAATVKRQSYLT